MFIYDNQYAIMKNIIAIDVKISKLKESVLMLTPLKKINIKVYLLPYHNL